MVNSKRTCLSLLVTIVMLVFQVPVLPISPTSAATGHPRLFFDAAQVPALQTQAATTHAVIWEPIRQYVDTLLDTAPPALAPQTDGDQIFMDSGDQIIPIAFACVITNDDPYCNLAKTYLLTYAGWTRWSAANSRGLGLAHMLFGNAIAYDWVAPRLSPDEDETVRRSLANWAQKMYEASVGPYNGEWDNFWYKSYLQNIYWISHSALGIAGLALLGEPVAISCQVSAGSKVNLRAGPSTADAVVGTLSAGESAAVVGQTHTDGYTWWHLADGSWVRADVVGASPGCDQLETQYDPQLWVDQARAKLSIGRDILDSIGDGSWHEGMHYLNYLLSYTLPFMINLKQIEGVDILPHQYLQHYADWALYNHLPNSTQFILSYGDMKWSWSNSRRPHHLLRFIASTYRDGYAEWLAQDLIRADGRTAELWSAPWYTFEFLYYDPAVTPLPPDDLPGGRTFPDAEAVIWRTGWGDDALIFGLKSGALGGRFAFDSFVNGLYPWEQPCYETGCTLITGHDHDDTNTFYLYRAGVWLAPEVADVDLNETSYHNTLLIDEQGQYRPPYDHFGGYADDFVNRDGFLEAAISGTQFHYVASDATRRYEIAGLEDVTRHVVAVRGRYFVMLDNLAADAPHQYDWIAHLSSGGIWGADNWIRVQAENGQILGIGVVAPTMYAIMAGDDGLPYVRIQPQQPVDDTRLIMLLYPTDEAGWAARPDMRLVEDNGQAVLLQAQTPAQRDDILIAYGSLGSTAGGYTFDGQVAVTGWGENGVLSAVFAYGGTALLKDGQVVAENLTASESFEAFYDGARLIVAGHGMTDVRLYAPEIDELTLNGDPWTFAHDGDYIIFSLYPKP